MLMKKLYVEQVHDESVAPAQLQPGQPWPKAYKVTKVVNATVPQIFEVLKPDQLDIYCESDLWDVTII